MMEDEREGVRAQKGLTHSSSICVEKAESCAVCTTKLSSRAEPKLLPCLHFMCKSCIVNIQEEKNAKECPTCGQSFNLSEVTDWLIFEDFGSKCGGCDETALSGWCKECEEALCSDCVSAHLRVKVTRNHTVIPQKPQSGLSTSLHCTSHRQERLKFFCVTCDQLTCRDCQLIDHRNHSFLLLEEAMVSQKDQLIKLLDSIREHKNRVQARLHDLDGRLNNVKESKALLEKQLHNVLHSLYTSLTVRCRQLSKELEGLCDEEEKSLKVMKTSLKKLEDRQEYITAFIHKILSTEGQCILRHKMQIEKGAQRVLSQKKLLPDTVIQFSLSLNDNVCHIIKNFASLKVTRVPLTTKGKPNNGIKPKNRPIVADKCSTGLNSEPGAAQSASSHSKPQDASDLPQHGRSFSSKPVQPTQGLTDTTSHSISSSVSHNYARLQTTQSNKAQDVVALVSQLVPQPVLLQPSKQVIRCLSDSRQSTSLLQGNSSVPGQTVLNTVSSSLPQHGMVMPQVVLPQSHSGVVISAAAPPGLASRPSVAQLSVSDHTPSFQSVYFNRPINTQSHTVTSNQSVPSFLSFAPFAPSSQAVSNFHQSAPNSSSSHTQQSVSQAVSQAVSQTVSQTVSGQSFTSQIRPTSILPTYSHTVSNTQAVNLQPSQSAGTQPNSLKLTLLNVAKNSASVNSAQTWKLYQYTPVLTANNGTALPCAPKVKKLIWMADKKSSLPTSGKVSFSLLDPRHNILPVSSDKELNPSVSNTSPLPAAPISSAYSNTGQIECATQTIQMPTCELPVKAIADSVCEGDISICSRASSVAEEADSNLPTSTVPEKDTQFQELTPVDLSRDPHSTTSVRTAYCPINKSCPGQSESESKSISTQSSTGSPSTKHWLTGLPSTFKEILCNDMKVPAEDARARSALEVASLPNAKQNSDEKTDSNSELVEGMDKSEELRLDTNRTPLVSLLQLPISGSSLSRFRIVPSSQKSEILLQEIDENQSIRRCLRITVPQAAASPSTSCSSEHFLQADVLDCAVCLSAGASLRCAECGRSFHTGCHVPPILLNPVTTWVCSLCQDVFDDTDPFSCDRLEEPYLSLPDQRRCEQLLLTLMCENNSYLLYKTIKQSAGCVEFNLIVGRLLGKRSPPYRSAAEMVSDLWALFDNLANSKKKNLVSKLQSSFQQRLNVSFGKSLHASLLRPLCSGDQTGAPETESNGKKTKNTLKRMREFLAASLVAKKAHTENA